MATRYQYQHTFQRAGEEIAPIGDGWKRVGARLQPAQGETGPFTDAAGRRHEGGIFQLIAWRRPVYEGSNQR